MCVQPCCGQLFQVKNETICLNESIGFCWLNIFHTGEINAWLQDETTVSGVTASSREKDGLPCNPVDLHGNKMATADLHGDS